MGLAANENSLWFNDSVSFFGLETTSNVIIFQHPFLVLKAASWEELLAHKVHASRHDKDILDAVRLLKEINSWPSFLETGRKHQFAAKKQPVHPGEPALYYIHQ